MFVFERVRIINYRILVVYWDKQNFFALSNTSDKPDTIELTINDKVYRLLLADYPEAWEQGLMHYRELPNADGMLFVFPIKDYHSFWNKNTFMDLDIYWVTEDTIVGTDFLPSIEKSRDIVNVVSPEPVNWVIEIVRKQERGDTEA